MCHTGIRRSKIANQTNLVEIVFNGCFGFLSKEHNENLLQSNMLCVAVGHNFRTNVKTIKHLDNVWLFKKSNQRPQMWRKKKKPTSPNETKQPQKLKGQTTKKTRTLGKTIKAFYYFHYHFSSKHWQAEIVLGRTTWREFYNEAEK